MPNKQNNLLWLDMEMTGLDPYIDTILEVAIIITDVNLNPLHDGFNIVVNHSAKILQTMDEWNQTNHSRTGLYQKVLDSRWTMTEAENQMLSYAKQYIDEKSSPLCGNTIWQDRMFLINYMPKFNGFMHYRNIDVSAFKEISYKWYPGLTPFKKKEKHSALQDVQESLDELKYYRQQIFKAQF